MVDIDRYFPSQDTRLDDKMFDDIINETLDTESMDISIEECTFKRNLLLSYFITGSIVEGYKPYSEMETSWIQQSIETECDSVELSTEKDLTQEEVGESLFDSNTLIVHSHDLMLPEYGDFDDRITFNDCRRWVIEESGPLIVLRKRKDNSVAISAIVDMKDNIKFKKAYGSDVIAVYSIPSNFKRVAGQAATNGMDIIKKYIERLKTYGFITKSPFRATTKSYTIDGISHEISTTEGVVELVHSLMLINNYFHNHC